MVERELDVAIRELNMSNDQLVIERARVDMPEASLAATFACLNKSIVDCTELCRLLVEAWG